jgi:hypothetical protein
MNTDLECTLSKSVSIAEQLCHTRVYLLPHSVYTADTLIGARKPVG